MCVCGGRGERGGGGQRWMGRLAVNNNGLSTRAIVMRLARRGHVSAKGCIEGRAASPCEEVAQQRVSDDEFDGLGALGAARAVEPLPLVLVGDPLAL